MAENSKIEWTDATWNPVLGCDKISPGCKGCYAIRTAWRLQHNPNPKVAKAFEGLTVIQGGQPNWTGRVNFVEDRLKEPLKWKKSRRIFVNSQSDLFHENLSDNQIAAVMHIMAEANWHTYQVLTKRADRLLKVLSALHKGHFYGGGQSFVDTFRHVWWGVSVENQQYADERIPLLLQTPAAVRWISAEPLLGPVDLDSENAGGLHALGCGWDGEGGWKNCPDRAGGKCEGIDWVVAGGESGPNARPMHPDWARSLRDQCKAAGVPFFFKQWGEWRAAERGDPDFLADSGGYRPDSSTHNWNVNGDLPDGLWSIKVGKKNAGRKLDGVEHNEYPLRPNQCNCSGSWHAIGSQGCTMEAART